MELALFKKNYRKYGSKVLFGTIVTCLSIWNMTFSSELDCVGIFYSLSDINNVEGYPFLGFKKF